MTDGDMHWTPPRCALSLPLIGAPGSEHRQSDLSLRHIPNLGGGENSEQSQPSTPADPTLTDSDHQIPFQILQVAWFLNALIDQHKEVNAQLIHEIQQTRIGHRRDLTTDRVNHAALATLSAELSIMANMLAQQHAANQEIEASPHKDDSI